MLSKEFSFVLIPAMSFHVRFLPVAQLKLLEFVGDLFLCIAVSICSFRFFNLQSVLRVNRMTIILSLTIVCHFITVFQTSLEI